MNYYDTNDPFIIAMALFAVIAIILIFGMIIFAIILVTNDDQYYKRIWSRRRFNNINYGLAARNHKRARSTSAKEKDYGRQQKRN